MPTKNKSRNNSRNSSRKSNASSEGKTPTVSVVDENEFASISITPKPPVVKKKTSVKQEESEPVAVAVPVLTAWEEMNMTESDFTAMLARVLLQYREGEKKDYEEYLLDELDTPSYWERQVETLERQREYFAKKRGWSAADIECVENIDSKLKECQKELIRIEELVM